MRSMDALRVEYSILMAVSNLFSLCYIVDVSILEPLWRSLSRTASIFAGDLASSAACLACIFGHCLKSFSKRAFKAALSSNKHCSSAACASSFLIGGAVLTLSCAGVKEGVGPLRFIQPVNLRIHDFSEAPSLAVVKNRL